MKNSAPFTVEADLELSQRLAPYLVKQGADVVIHQGEVPERLEGDGPDGAAYQVRGRQMLLTVPNGLRYLIDDGRRIVYARDERHGDRDVALFLLGSAWAALCYQRGLIPLHASAVVANGAVHAFTGPSGAGKSTLAAALASHGPTFFTDDVLILDPARLNPHPLCFAAHYDLKLWADAIALTKSARGEPVRDVPGFDKYHSPPSRQSGLVAGRLGSLFFLDDAGATAASIDRVEGGSAVIQLASSVYRPAFASAILGRRALFDVLGALVQRVTMLRFSRPFDRAAFPGDIDRLRDWIYEHG